MQFFHGRQSFGCQRDYCANSIADPGGALYSVSNEMDAAHMLLNSDSNSTGVVWIRGDSEATFARQPSAGHDLL